MSNLDIYESKLNPAMWDKVSDDAWTRKLNEEKVNLLKKWFTKGRAIDLGAGSGLFIRHIINDAEEILAIDFDKRSLDLICDKYHAENKKLKTMKADLNEVELPKDYATLVYGYAVLYQVENLRYLFEQVYQALKPNGFFIAEVGNSTSLPALVAKYQYEAGNWGQCFPLTMRRIHCLIDETGFYLDEIRSAQIMPVCSVPKKNWYWLPVLNGLWRYPMGFSIGKKNLDELLANTSIGRNTAFRQILVLRKPEASHS